MPRNRFVKNRNRFVENRSRLIKPWFVRVSLFDAFFSRNRQPKLPSFLAFILILLGMNPVRAQIDPVEPPVLPDQTPTTLADLYRDYKELGLPLPPKGARLVFADESQAGPALGIVQRQPESLALCFEIQPSHKGQPGEFLIGFDTKVSRVPVQELRSPIDMRIVAGLFGAVAADPDQPVVWQPWFDRDLILAIQCHAEGQNELAEFLLDRCRARTPIPLKKRLLLIAWNHWVDQLTMPDSDRGALTKRLKEMMAKNPECVVDSTRQLIADLEATLKSPINRNVQNEVLIERVVEYSHRTDCELYVIQEGDSIFERYRNDRMRNRASAGVILSLAELGFEVDKVAQAAPIDHLARFLGDFEPVRTANNQKRQVRFLATFLHDLAIWEVRYELPLSKSIYWGKEIEIRQLACLKLAALWEISEIFPNFTPGDWQRFRERIHARVEKELANE